MVLLSEVSTPSYTIFIFLSVSASLTANDGNCVP
nr:MAG TPA: hypothetical protein [Caudoviricetes sp.]DAU88346.1 MAG TPA: hypothetical protein [Caudoviricetes sp.]